MGLLFSLASFKIIFIILMGSSVDPPGISVKLLPFNMLCLAINQNRRFISIFITAFLIMSNKVKGRVLIISHCQSISLGMR